MAGSLVKQILMAITADPGDSHEVLSDRPGCRPGQAALKTRRG